MSIFSKLFGSKTKSFTPIMTAGGVFTGFESAGDIKSLNSYKKSLYLYIATSKVAKRVAGVPLELYKIKGKKGDVEEVLDHPLFELLAKPNALQSGRQFFELSVTHYLLAGDCFWLITREGKTITELLPLRPDRVRIVMNERSNSISHYEYTAHRVYRFETDEIIHTSNIDPENPLRGVGAVTPASARISAEYEATNYQANFFKNQGRPDMVVLADQEITEEQGDDFRAKWKRLFGNGNSGQVAILGANVKSVDEVNKTPKEMDFIESQKFLRDDILASLHVPKAMVTTDDVNLANSKEAYRMFLQEGVVPVLEAFVDTINNTLIPLMDITVFIAFSDPVPVDRDMLLKEATELKRHGIISANEARLLFNYEPIDGHDDLMTSSQSLADLATKAKHIIRRRPILAKRLDAIEKTVTLLMHSNEPKRQMNSVFATRELKDSYAKAYNAKADHKADGLAEEINKYHDGLMERILATDLNVASFMDMDTEKRLAREALAPAVVKIYKDGGQEAMDALFRKSSTDFFVDELMLASLQQRIFFFSDSMTETTHDILKGRIVAGISTGDGIDAIAGSLREYFSDMGQKRALTIARTETGFALSKATNDAYMQSSIVTGKEWINVGDDDVRHDHKDVSIGGLNGGVIVAKGGAFPNGEHYPAEHSINCRCVLAPAV